MSHRASAVLFAAALVGALIACAGRPAVTPNGRAGRETKSNIARADYAGSAACARCHAGIAEKWGASPMHNMTRSAAAGVSRAPWSGVALRFKDDSVELSERDGARFVHVHSARFGDADYRVTRVIGGHYREDYAGVPIGSSTRDELIMPISYLLWSKKFRYKGYSVMSRERPGLAAGPVWNRTCIFCHNTEPYLDDMLGGLLGDLSPSERRHAAYQGELVDPLLPAGHRWPAIIEDPGALKDALDDEIAHLGGARESGSVAAVAMHAIRTTRDRFAADDLIEVGIGCESCHGGSIEHARDPSVHTSFAPHGAGVRFSGSDEPAQRINRTCARCHQVLFSRYPYTWEGGLRDADPPGGSEINSGEGRDFLLSRCSKRASCTLCHDPHSPQDTAKEGDAICTQCHASLASGAAQRAHTHHDPAGAGGRCVACHMPKKNMTLDLRLGRYHRIASPNEPAKMLDRPLECALCHGDWTVRKTADEMEKLWGKRIDRAVLDGVYGDLDQNVLDATLARGKPHEKAVAMSLLGDRKDKRAARAISAELLNEYPLVRFYAERALERISGDPSPIDLNADDPTIRAQASEWATRITR
ncbi:MAG TPA: cytochrome c3 family protein [Polyangiaceae bacterium]|jgi:predicted CXXCH cytochrome family protein